MIPCRLEDPYTKGKCAIVGKMSGRKFCYILKETHPLWLIFERVSSVICSRVSVSLGYLSLSLCFFVIFRLPPGTKDTYFRCLCVSVYVCVVCVCLWCVSVCVCVCWLWLAILTLYHTYYNSFNMGCWYSILTLSSLSTTRRLETSDEVWASTLQTEQDEPKWTKMTKMNQNEPNDPKWTRINQNKP